MEKSTLIWLTLLLVTVMILWPTIGEARTAAINYAQGGICQMSVGLASLEYTGFCSIVDVESPFSYSCPRHHIDIEEGTRVYEDKKSQLTYQPYKF